MKAILALLFMTTCATADVCRVSDPAPPLNIRIYPNGKIVGSLPNGTRVTTMGRIGKWSSIAIGDDPSSAGWVFDQYLDCSRAASRKSSDYDRDPAARDEPSDDSPAWWECVVAKVSPADHDSNPGYRVNLTATFTQNNKIDTFEAVHTRLNGIQSRRSEQYAGVQLIGDRNRIQWSGWRGKSTQMLGTLYSQNGHWVYDETIRQDGRVAVTINSVCHETDNTL
jgi:hypothetical protein